MKRVDSVIKRVHLSLCSCVLAQERARKAAIAAAATTGLVSPTPVSTPYFEQPTAVNVSGFHDGRTGLVDRHNEDEERRYNEVCHALGLHVVVDVEDTSDYYKKSAVHVAALVSLRCTCGCTCSSLSYMLLR